MPRRGFPNLPTVSALISILAGAASGLGSKVAGLLGKHVTDKGAREALQRELDATLTAHAAQVQQLVAEAEEARAADAKDARAHDLAVQQATAASWLAKNVGYLLDLLVAVVWGACTVYLLLRALKLVGAGGVDLTGVLAIYSTLTAVFMTIVTFHRGSSRSSQEKDAALRASLTSKP